MESGQYNALLKHVEAFARAYVDEHELPGLAIALTDRDSLIGHLELGYANIDSKAPILPETLFEFGSIGKSFTGICLLQLAAEGVIDLHQPIAEYLPWFEVKTEYEPITIHHLLSHSSGLIGGTDFTPGPQFECWSLRHTETRTPPGAKFHYSNIGYKCLGLLLERLTSKPYAEIVEERIFGPLGMTEVAGAITNDMRHRLAVGYQDYFDDRPRLKGHGVAPAPWLETDTGDGCLCASASDLALYLRMLLNRGAYPGGRILSVTQFESMTTPYIDAGEDASYGYGISRYHDKGRGRFGHTGGMIGYISMMEGDLDTGFGAIALTNSMNGVRPITEFAMTCLAAVDRGDGPPDPPVLHEDKLESYARTYFGSGGSITVSIGSDRLRLERDGASQDLIETAYRDGSFVLDSPGDQIFSWRFQTDEDEAMTSVIHGGEEFFANPEAVVDVPANPEHDALVGHYRSYNPWGSNFRVVSRGGNLWMSQPWGDESEIEPLEDGYRVDADEGMPERIWFETVIDGRAQQIRDSLGSTWHRVFTA